MLPLLMLSQACSSEWVIYSFRLNQHRYKTAMLLEDYHDSRALRNEEAIAELYQREVRLLPMVASCSLLFIPRFLQGHALLSFTLHGERLREREERRQFCIWLMQVSLNACSECCLHSLQPSGMLMATAASLCHTVLEWSQFPFSRACFAATLGARRLLAASGRLPYNG